MELDLRHALQGPVTEFVVHYQPVVHLDSGKVVAVESLVRWQHPTRGLLGPDRFIPMTEAAGLVGQLGAWVLSQSLRDAPRLTHEGRELDIAVNLSVLQLDNRIVTDVQTALDNSGTRPSRLILEVTESAFVEDEDAATSSLRALSQLGVNIAIDDFGTGYSSLLHLRRFPIDTLKIDRAFVSGIGGNAGDEAICASIVNLAADLGTSSVAEGVETKQQCAALKALGCVQGQGFLWSPAVPIDEFGAALASCERVRGTAPQTPTLDALEGVSTKANAVIDRMRTEGASMHTIAAALNRTVGPHPKGVRWTASAVAQSLAS